MNRLSRWLLRAIGIKELAPGVYSLRDHDFVRHMGGHSTYAGTIVSEHSALSVATVYGCVRVLSETMGALPKSIFERDGKGNATKVEHDLGDVLIAKPNDEMTGVELMETLTSNLALQGNCYSFVDRNGAENVSSIYPIPAPMCEPFRDRQTQEIKFRVNERGKWETYPAEKIWHVKGFGSNGLMGYSALGYARHTIGTMLAAQQFQANFFANGASPSWLLSIPHWLDKDQREKAQDNLNRLWGGVSNSHKAQLLEGGMTATAATMPLVDAQFLELLGHSSALVCGIFRVPPHMIGDLSRSTNNNIEHQGLEFSQYSMLPYTSRIESSALRWLLRPKDRGRFFLRFNLDSLLRADHAGRASFYSTMLQNGVLNRNEVRALENRNSVPGLDDFTVQSNMTLMEQLAKLVAAQSSVAPKPAPVLPEREEAKHSVTVVTPDAHPEIKTLVNSVRQFAGSSSEVFLKASAEQAAVVQSLVEAVRLVTKQSAVQGEQTALRIAEAMERSSETTAQALKEFSEVVRLQTKVAAADRSLVFSDNGDALGSQIDPNLKKEIFDARH